MGLLMLVLLGLWAYCLLDVVTTPAEAVRNLPRLAWIIVVLLLSPFGSIMWLFFGRPHRAADDTSWTEHPSFGGGERSRRPWTERTLWSGAMRGGDTDEQVRPRLARRPRPRPLAPDDDPEFLRELSERIRRDGDNRR